MSIIFFEYKVSNKYPPWPPIKKTIINTINPHSFCVAKRDKYFKEALLNSDILVPDGIGIVLACRLVLGVKIDRITGAEMHNYLLKEAEKNKLKVFYLGATKNTLGKISKKISEEHPNITFASFSPKFKPTFTEQENLEMVKIINQFSPDILFVGMTAPKQEKWSYINKENLNATIIASVGAVFDFYSGNIKRAPKWTMKIGMEWLYRFFREPKRMWKRYFINNAKFIYFVLKATLKQRT